MKALLEVTRVQERMTSVAGEERMGVARLNTILGRVPARRMARSTSPRGDPPRGRVRTPPRRTSTAILAFARPVRPLTRRSRARRRRDEGKPDWMVQGGYMLIPGEAGALTARVGLTWPTAPWAEPRLTASVREATGAA